MVGIGEARVLILDDQPSEATPILTALARRGIPAVWFTGRVRELPPPDKPLRHVRLALLDVELVRGGADKRSIITTLVSRVRRLLPKDTPGLGVVLWTRHSEWHDDVLNALLEQGGPVPSFVAALRKEDFRNEGGFDWARLETELVRLFSEASPWPTLLAWEDAARDGGSEVVDALARLAQGMRPKPTTADEVAEWRVGVRGALSALLIRLAQAEAGKHMQTGRDLIHGFTAALNPLLQDEAETRIHARMAELSTWGDSILTEGMGVTVPFGTNAQLNAKLTLATPSGPLQWTGNVYVLRGTRGLAAAFRRSMGNRDFSDILIESLVDRGAPAKVDERRAKLKEGFLDTVLVDINPSCDHAQQKTHWARLVAGAKVLSSHYTTPNIMKSIPAYIHRMGPFKDSANTDEYLIILDIRTVFTCSNAVLSKIKPKMRVRHLAAADVQARIAAHGGRIGVLTVEGPEA